MPPPHRGLSWPSYQKRAAPPFPMACFSFLPSPLCYLHCITCSLMTSSPWWSIPWYSVDSLLCSQCRKVPCLAYGKHSRYLWMNEWLKKKKKQWLRNTRGNVLSLKELEKAFQEAECPSIPDGDDGDLGFGCWCSSHFTFIGVTETLCKDGHCSLEEVTTKHWHKWGWIGLINLMVDTLFFSFFFQVYWDIIDIWHCVSLGYIA